MPPLVTISLALTTRRVLPSLFVGVLASQIVLTASFGAAIFATFDSLIDTATNRGNFILIAFSLMVGGLLQLIREGNGFQAFAVMLERARNGLGRGTVFALNWVIGAGMMLDVWSNVLVNGATSASLYEKLGLSRLRMAYFIHTIAISIVAMATINGWGAFYLGLLNAQKVDEPLRFIVASIPYMLYNWTSLVLVAVVMATGMTIGPLRRFELAHASAVRDAAMVPDDSPAGPQPRAVYMLLPLLVLFVTVFASLWVTGKGDLLAGDAGLSIFYAVALASATIALLLIALRARSPVAVEEAYVAGIARFMDVGIMMVLALALGALTRDLGTGPYIAELSRGTVPTALMPALIFLLGAVMSFATGTSYGTYSIMVPIALPLAMSTGLDPHLMFGAVIAGGLFGDNSSPISDTTMITSVAAEVKIIDHVATQLPYALISAGFALTGFIILGVFR